MNETYIQMLEENLAEARKKKGEAKTEIGESYMAGYESAILHAIGILKNEHGSVTEAARALGKVKSTKKAATSAANGALGGRPRKERFPHDGTPLQG